MVVSGKYRVFINTTTWEPYYWDTMAFDEEKFWKFVEENPMAKSKVYNSPEELIKDFKNAKGVISLPCEENSEFVWWMEDLLEYLDS